MMRRLRRRMPSTMVRAARSAPMANG
jgi:hypothetical protein